MLRYLPLLALGLLLPQDEAQIRTWIKQLDDAGIEVREQALRELIKAGATAEPLLREAQQSESPEVRMRAAEALGAIALARKAKEVYREPAPLTLSHENAPISAILEDLAARSGLRIDASAVKLEGETASLKLESGTAMQALDLLCAGRSNLSWEWKEGGAVKMTSSPHVAYPSVYSGPFKVYISSLNIVRHTNFKETTATLSLGISTLYETHLNPMKGVKFEFGKGVDDTGSELSVETSGGQIQAGAGGWAIQVVQGALGGGGGGPTPDASAQVFSVKGLAPEAKSIKSLPGTVTFSFPLEHTEISFESPSRGDTKESGDFVFRIEKIEKNGITFKVSSKKKDGPAIDMARLLDSESAKAVDDEGKTHKADTLALAQTNEGGMVIRMIGGAGGVFGVESSTETLYRATFSTVKGRDIETFTFRFIDRTLEKVVPFELRDVKLP